MIKVKNLSKKFLVPHEKRFGFRDYFVNLFSRVRYDKFYALDNITFNVASGEWLGVIGRNGSGKSTLLKILAGIYTPDSGEIETSGSVVPFLELGVGFEPELSARNNIFLNGLLLGIPRKTIKENFDDIMRFAEVESFVDQKLKNFSSGMKVRLAFAVAMYAPADIFLIDEILAVGDYSFQQKSTAAFKEKLKGKTVVLVSHDMDKVRENCHRAIWLKNGKVEEIGKPEKVIGKYLEDQNA